MNPSRLALILIPILLTLAAVEGLAWWWMNPPLAGAGEPVLAYRPGIRSQECTGSGSVPSSKRSQTGMAGSQRRQTGVRDQEEAPAQDTKHQALATSPVAEFQLLPEVVSQSMPSLRCTSGMAACIDRPDGITVHVAFFEWDRESSTNVLEAFKHLPEQCMGSIGMTLVKMHPPRRYEVRDRRSEVRDQESGGLDRDGAEIVDRRSEIVDAPFSSPHDRQSKIENHPPLPIHDPQSTIHDPPSPHRGILTFDHTEFRDPAGRPVHAFKGVWVSGADTLLGDGIRGGEEQWRQLRWRAALKRFRPAHARTTQGAVHGIANPDRAWEIFQESMLKDLTFEP